MRRSTYEMAKESDMMNVFRSWESTEPASGTGQSVSTMKLWDTSSELSRRMLMRAESQSMQLCSILLTWWTECFFFVAWSQETMKNLSLLERARLVIGTTEGRVDSRQLEETLEPAVLAQCKENSYDADVNTAVLKHYALVPDLFNFDYVRMILAKAMMQLPHKDFTMMLYLVPETYYTDTEFETPEGFKTVEPAMSPVLQTIVNLESCLRSCQFVQFWKQVRTDEKLGFLKEIAGFTEAIREYILHVVGLSHRSIKIKLLAQMLELPKNTEFDKLVAARGWTVEGDLLKKLVRANITTDVRGRGVLTEEVLQQCIKAVSLH
eukprot:Gregarina_sp_Poly_1__11018@NODE_879_length_5888_cov_545_981446_g629_i0_p3_GENE_NODE_879_length_5888_cov_545_981446_g629_i0NODE_879_length_5888_cov_545_981446_g629_i0_p3_ORF_typecomplete_len322_score45_20CSN8_PSD8_EIF3K/PF10075_9/2_9e03CSN8_PSD8_EIF3K/PF10075_9/2_9e28PCI/PF01399_27/0_11_NODE_879_length_5888_cov_545_981446_g629_i022523217